ncbi:TIM barrel protein [uncultured Kriegella sp.]|uniref:sugar phosphate isomerase/epimerase family protein n=1 Tax=uncultured Kriegella sp. TaxID=1798910 RepID=UPI0030D89D4C|tara:strand:+ start:18982 stop:19947 length:966 start_codon:yes stop_codon:yes gene_type:complete
MKKGSSEFSRREFVKLSASALVATPLIRISNPFYENATSLNDDVEVHIFSKHLQFLDYNGMSEVAAQLGFDGIDLTVRPKGHVLPERVKDDLPQAALAMRKFGLKTRTMTTNVLDVTNKEQILVLETASNLGFTHYRTGWLDYPIDRTIAESQTIFGQQFKNVARLNKQLGLIGGYQNHAGNHVGAPIWDLPPILKEADEAHMGCQYDIRHAVVEGGSSWELGLRLIQPFIKSIVIKDFKWGTVDGKWQPINTPLGEGMVDFPRYFSLLKKYGINVPISLHLEYDLGGAEHGAAELTIKKEEVFRYMKKDLAFLRETWHNA